MINRKLTLAMTTALVAGSVHAGVSYEDIWFPDGEVRYFIEADAVQETDTIEDVMTYMAQYTPLKISAAATASDGNLHFAGDWLAPNGGGYTNYYWDENHNDANQKIRFDPNFGMSRTTVAHEFGHALGWPHEFQRDDRDEYVEVCFNVDPFNFSKAGSAFWPDPYNNLSPYDYGSIMNSGYSSCVDNLPGNKVQSRSYSGVWNLLSAHDVNSIYRMHAEGLGTNEHGDRFGVAVGSGDYDDDGFKDVVVANVEDDRLWLVFYRGVATDNSENVAGLKWMPWFHTLHDGDVNDKDVTFATGDFNGDGIDDLAVGQPGFDNNRGRVSLLFVNTLPSDPGKNGTLDEDFAPWGNKGIEYRHDLYPEDYGLTGYAFFNSYYPRFGESLAAFRGSNYRDSDNDPVFHDLAIGAPQAGQSVSIDPSAKGAVLLLKGRVDTSPEDFDIEDHERLWSPNPSAEFGAAVAAIPGRCNSSSAGTVFDTDFLAVGSPGYSSERGGLLVYGCSTTGTSSVQIEPPLESSLYGVGSDQRFGHALAGFSIDTGMGNDTFVAVGHPDYVGSNGVDMGRVAVYEISRLGSLSFETSFIPNIHDGNDDFGFALAVQQRPASNQNKDEGGYETYLGIGMPGARVDGHKAGKVVVWRPFNDDGSHNWSANTIEAANPVASSQTRFGKSIAALRPLKKLGGFVAGAPRAVTLSDNVEAGQVSTLQNDGGDFGWTTVRRNLNQETEGDQRPGNL